MADLILVALDGPTNGTFTVNQPVNFICVMEGNDETQSDTIVSVVPYVYQLDTFSNNLGNVPFSCSNSFDNVNGLVVPRKPTQDEIDAGEVQVIVYLPFSLTFFAPTMTGCYYTIGCIVTDQYGTTFDTGDLQITVINPI